MQANCAKHLRQTAWNDAGNELELHSRNLWIQAKHKSCVTSSYAR